MAFQADLLNPDFYVREDSHDALRWLRENDPVHRFEGPYGGVWALTKHADIVSAAASPAVFSNSRGAEPIMLLTEAELLSTSEALMNLDPPKHREVRKGLASTYSPLSLGRFDEAIHRIAREVVDGLPSGKTVDICSTFSEPFCLRVSLELMGLPCEDAEDVRRWRDDLMDHGGSQPEPEEVRETVIASAVYFYEIMKERRSRPRDDLISSLVEAQASGAPLSDGDILMQCINILIAANQGPRHLVDAAVWCLLKHPSELERVTGEPTLVPKAVEETLRWYAPATAMARWAVCDIDVRGRAIASGDGVLLLYLSANRDEELWGDDADRFSILRERPDRHLTFGSGKHKCLGSWLARLMGATALRALLARYPQIEPRGDAEVAPSFQVKAIQSLPIYLPAH